MSRQEEAPPMNPIPGYVSPGVGLPALLYTGQPIVGQHVFIPVPLKPVREQQPKEKGKRSLQ